MPTEHQYREAIFRAAPSHQGGHSDTGAAIAECLGVGFPLDVSGLERKAKAEGFDTTALWPWLYKLRASENRQGGPTEAEPNRSTCKPDGSCCDFACGN